MRYPKSLQKGGRIGFIAPSFGCSIQPYETRFNNALKTFHNLGYKTIEGPNARAGKGIGISNTPMACGAEVNDFFINDRSDVIISCGGGELMCEDLPYIDFVSIKKATPKWYLGYSDNTNLTFTLPTICDIAAIYGPCASDFGMSPWHESIEDAFKVLTGEKTSFSNYDGWEIDWPEGETNPLAPFSITQLYSQVIFGADEVHLEGRLIGGCMDVLENIIGTPFDYVSDFNERYREDGIIWFLESCDLNVMSIRRTLWHMKQAGWFKYVNGFLIGRPLKYDDEFDGFRPHEAVTGVLSDFGVPIVMDIDLGHLSPQIPFVSGGYGHVDAVGNKFGIKYDMK